MEYYNPLYLILRIKDVHDHPVLYVSVSSDYPCAYAATEYAESVSLFFQNISILHPLQFENHLINHHNFYSNISQLIINLIIKKIIL